MCWDSTRPRHDRHHPPVDRSQLRNDVTTVPPTPPVPENLIDVVP